jgi:quercetin dioxygenase-like cupin family protein
MNNEAHALTHNPIHLGLGATAVVEPDFTGDMAWYNDYAQRHGDDGFEGRLVSMSDHAGAWDMWEMHPHGAEVVLCTAGTLSMTQELPGGEHTVVLQAGEYLINPPGVWHTANEGSAGTAMFITAGVGTEHRPR